jgi:hypothetical protein
MLVVFLRFVSVAGAEDSRGDLLLVLGAPGEAQYGELFQTWAERWKSAAQRGGLKVSVIGKDQSETGTHREQVQHVLKDSQTDSERPLWLVLIGHGTYDGKSARFNLAGPDVSADELATWLTSLKRPVAVIDCSASSAPFLLSLSAPARIVITATKSGGEENFARFGEFLAQSIDDPTADLDKDDQTSLWEAYLSASRKTQEFYESDGRLMTEHALLDDNGDQQGTRADLFRGLQVRDGLSIGHPVDGAIAHRWHLVPSPQDAELSPEIRHQRDQLELEVLELRKRKSTLNTDEYYQQLEKLLVELATLNHTEN